MFQWNGDVFDFAGQPLASRHASDTLFMAAKLAECFRGNKDDESNAVLRCLEQVQGPWAFVFWHKERRSLWFGRDYFGRQSLLMHVSAAAFILSSCAPIDEKVEMEELPAHGIYRLQLGERVRKLELFPWDIVQTESIKPWKDLIISETRLRCPVNINAITAVKSNPVIFDHSFDVESVFERLLASEKVRCLVTGLIERLTDAIRIRVENQPGRCKNCIKARFHALNNKNLISEVIFFEELLLSSYPESLRINNPPSFSEKVFEYAVPVFISSHRYFIIEALSFPLSFFSSSMPLMRHIYVACFFTLYQTHKIP